MAFAACIGGYGCKQSGVSDAEAEMHGILIYVVLAVFISGLMVGRTPEYLGKKFEAYDVKMAMVVASRLPAGDSRIHGILIRQWLWLLEHNQLWAARLQPGVVRICVWGRPNNGSAFAGLNANTLWYNTAVGFDMLIGRILMIIPMLAIAGNLADKKYAPPSLDFSRIWQLSSRAP